MKQVRLFLFAILLAVAGCGPIYETQYTLIPPDRPDAGMCLNQCQQITQYCRRNCALEERACVADEREHALREYRHYVRERKAAKQPVKRSPADFERSWMCRDSACEAGCAADYRGCYAGCGGTVIPRRVCTMFCDQ